MISFVQRSALDPALRADYLDRLPEPQELFVEDLVAGGRYWSIRRGGGEIGYAVIHGDDTLVELHLSRGDTRHIGQTFHELISRLGVTRVLAKTFDATLMFAALTRPWPFQTVGMLYRVIADPGFSEDARIQARAATLADLATLLDLGADFFDGPAEIEAYMRMDGLMIYQTRQDGPIGAGVMKRVIAGRDDIDIGMVVGPTHRRRGFGAHIIAHLKHHCLARGGRPICGCAVDNIASQRTLERAGFASRHRLVEFEVATRAEESALA